MEGEFRRASIAADVLVPVQRAHVRLDELERLFQRVRIAQTRVEDVHAERHVRQEDGVAVDEVDGVEHRLGALDALVLLDGAAHLAADAHFVQRKQSAEDDVAVDDDSLVLVCRRDRIAHTRRSNDADDVVEGRNRRSGRDGEAAGDVTQEEVDEKSLFEMFSLLSVAVMVVVVVVVVVVGLVL